jgi:hypothetical protein
VTLQARALLLLQLKKFEQPRLVICGRHHLQLTPAVGQHQPGGVGPEQFHGLFAQHLQQLRDFELAD